MATATRELMVFKGHNLRTAISDEGEPGVLLADISTSIGIKRSRNIAPRLPNKDAFIKGTLTPGGMQDMWYVTESGIYAVLVGSRKPLAKELTKVLLTELPKLRKQVVHSTDVLAPQSDHWAVLKAVAAGMIDMQADMEAVKSDIAILKANNEVKLLANPVSTLTLRQETVAMIDRHMREHPGDFATHKDAFTYLWDLCRLNLHRDIAGEARKCGWKSIIAYAEYIGEMERVHRIAQEVFGKPSNESEIPF